MKRIRKRKNLASLISSLWRRAFQSRFESLNGSAPERKKQKSRPRKFNSKIKDREIEISIITYCLSRLSILRVLCSILVIIASASAFSASTISPLPAILSSLSLFEIKLSGREVNRFQLRRLAVEPSAPCFSRFRFSWRWFMIVP